MDRVENTSSRSTSMDRSKNRSESPRSDADISWLKSDPGTFLMDFGGSPGFPSSQPTVPSSRHLSASGPGAYLSYSNYVGSSQTMTARQFLRSITGHNRNEMEMQTFAGETPTSIGPYLRSREKDTPFENEVNHRLLGMKTVNRSVFPDGFGFLGRSMQMLSPTRGTNEVPEVYVVNTSDNGMVIDCDMAIIVSKNCQEAALRVGKIKCSRTKIKVTVELVDHAYRCCWKRHRKTNLLQVPILELWVWDIVCVAKEWDSLYPEGTAQVVFRGEHTCMEIGCLQEHMVDDRFDLLVRGCNLAQYHASKVVWKYPMRLALTEARREAMIHMNRELRQCIRTIPSSTRVVETKCNWLVADMALNLSAGTTVVYARSLQNTLESTSISEAEPHAEIHTSLGLGLGLKDRDHVEQSAAKWEEYQAKYEQEDAHKGLIENGRTTPHADAIRPPKMWNIAFRRVVKTATWSESEWEKTFFLSYVWNQWADDEVLAEKLVQLGGQLGRDYCWVDRWCIDQNSPEDKEEQLPLMGDYYEGAPEVVVLMPEITEIWRGCVEVRGQMVHAEAIIAVNFNLLKQYNEAKWMERVWTFQEGYRATNILLSTQTQLLDMTVVNTVLMASIRGQNNGFLTIGGYTTPGCVTYDAINHFLTHVLQPTGTIAARKRVIQSDNLPNKDTDLSAMLLLIAHRKCREEQDRLHAIIGLVRDTNIEVDYQTPLENRLRDLARQGSLDSRVLFGSSVSKTPNECWLPAFGENKVEQMTLSGVDACSIKPLSNGRVEVQARRVTGKIDGNKFIMTDHEKTRTCQIRPGGKDGVTVEDVLLIVKGSDEIGEGLLVAGEASGRVLHRKWGKMISLKKWQLEEPIESWEIGGNIEYWT